MSKYEITSNTLLTCKIYSKLIEEKKLSEFYFFFFPIVSLLITFVLSHLDNFFIVVWQKTSANMLLCIFLLLYQINFLSWITPALFVFSLCFLLSFADPYFIFTLGVFFHLSLPSPCCTLCIQSCLYCTNYQFLTISQLQSVFPWYVSQEMAAARLLSSLKFIALSVTLKCAARCG